ncbi:MAG: hypothetical protein ACFCUR_02535 [Rhodomicrobiaceae bacterium]
MKNIERFNLYTAYLFGKLYEEFPVHREIVPVDIVDTLKLPPPEKLAKNHDARSTDANFVAHTVMWLVDTGYIILRSSGANRKRYVLAPKAFEALSATLSALEGKKAEEDEKSVGERLSEIAADAGKEAAKEGWRKTISEMVGQVIGHAMKAFTSPG